MSNFTPESVMAELAFLIRLIYTALDTSVSKAREYFAKQEYEDQRNVDKYLAPNMIRWETLSQLKRAGQNAREEEENGISMSDLPNNGIHIDFKNYSIKVLKSQNGDLPVPGYSQSRRNFYDQPNLYDGDFSSINLLLLWNIDKPYSLGLLSLACPKSGEETRESVSHHWHCRIPNRILYGEFNETDKIEPNEILDLDIDIDLDETGTDDEK